MNKSETKTKNSIARIWTNNLYALKTLFGPTPIYGISIIVEAIRHNLINFLEQTVCVYLILDAIETKKSYFLVIEVVVCFIILDIIAACISTLYEQKIKIKYLPIAQRDLKNKLFQKAKEVDLCKYDNPSYYNEYCLVVSEAEKAVERAEQLVRMFFGSVTILLCYGVFFVTQDFLSILFVIISFVLRTVFSNLSNKLRYDLRINEVPLERKRDYIRRLFYLKDYAKEIRLNKRVTQKFYDEFDSAQEELYSLQKKYSFRKFLLNFTAKYVSSDFLLDIIYVVYLIIKASVFKLMAYSQVVVLYNSATGLRRGLSTVTDLGPYAVETSLYIDRIRRFLDSETSVVNNKKRDIPKRASVLECKNVSFGYDNDRIILKKINIIIKPGEKIAFVGNNGAGKTTLIKLVLRFYDPSEGQILLDGTDIRDYDIDEYRKYIGVVFQDFQVYATNIMENVIMDVYESGDEKTTIEALKKSGFYNKMLKLPLGVKTELTNEFETNGTELSGGEEQKLAIARTFYKDSGIMLLDEPSSALDPIAEYEMNCTLQKMAKDKNVMFISHRLSTTRNADRIYVLQNGGIVEEGSHDELLMNKGIYYTMWNAQAMKYVES